MDDQMQLPNVFALTMSVGRDYRLPGRYEFVIFQGEQVIARKGFFSSYAAAKRAGLTAAAALNA